MNTPASRGQLSIGTHSRPSSNSIATMPQQHSPIPDSHMALNRGPYSKTQARIDKLSAYPECEIVDGLMVNCLCCGISIALDVREKALKKGGYYTYNWEKHIRQTSHSKALRAWNRKQRSMDRTEHQDMRAETPVSDCPESRSQSVSGSYFSDERGSDDCWFNPGPAGDTRFSQLGRC